MRKARYADEQIVFALW